MASNFLAELGKQLADRWLTLLVLPGALYVATLTVGHALGHRHPFDVGRLTDGIHDLATSPQTSTGGGLAVILLAALLAASAAGFVAQGLGGGIERLWFAADWIAWPPPLRHLAAWRTRKRQKRWADAERTRERLRVEAARAYAVPADRERPDAAANAAAALETARQSVRRIAAERPARPTWIGDRVHGVTVKLDRAYALDFATAWPHLWLTVPDVTRSELTAVRVALTRATVLVGWGLLYLMAAAVWWPAGLVGVGVMATGRRRAWHLADTYATLLEAATRLYAGDLARQLGLDNEGPLNSGMGWAITCALQGREELIRLAALPPPGSTS
ncbi:hypothetical protein ACFYNL_39230 [Streptomyces sp. NPDC007808]|uniref:hypothetical protein n=1 Tax=Streptomyces sp. NPDC007808 TaxID=3364779 RepID=UPI003675C4B1